MSWVYQVRFVMQGAAQSVGTPTNIVLLKNMVGPGEVDDGLEDEVAEEVSKFGEVFRVLIFEVSGVPVAPHQAVRAASEYTCCLLSSTKSSLVLCVSICLTNDILLSFAAGGVIERWDSCLNGIPEWNSCLKVHPS
jgi:hypothetical protein